MIGEKKPRALTRAERTELRVLTAIGIRRFRDLMFRVEGCRHRKTGGVNRNYHLDRMSGGAAEDYRCYLWYNASLHMMAGVLLVAGIVFIAAMDWFSVLSAAASVCVVSVFLLLVLFNLYCLLLQRYNSLRVRRCACAYLEGRSARIDRAAEAVLGLIPSVYTKETALDDAERLDRIVAALANGQVVFLGEEDLPTLVRAGRLMDTPRTHAPALPDNAASCPINELARRSRYAGSICGKAERRVAAVTGRKPRAMRTEAIITENRTVEEAFRHLFGFYSPERILERTEVLTRALHCCANGDE